MTQADVLEEVAAALNDLGVPWCLVGSYATSAHGEPRTTHDVDIVLVLGTEAAAALASKLGDAYYVDPVAIAESLAAGLPHNLIHQATQERVDLWPLKDEPYERTQFSRRLTFHHRGQQAYVQAAEDAVLSKLRWLQASEAPRHYDDARSVVAHQGASLDRDYLRRWAAELGVLDLLEQLLSEADRPS